jgi:hypothetical protein
LLLALIGFETVTFAPGTPPREEEALQRFLASVSPRAAPP